MLSTLENVDFDEHPLDVMQFAVNAMKCGAPTALAIVTQTEGGSVRSRGAMLAATETGEKSGYLSGGCIDEDVVAQAMSSLQQNKVLNIRYGKGSPFLDIRLPCGGAIDIIVLPSPSIDTLELLIQQLKKRRIIRYKADASGIKVATKASLEPNLFVVRPKLKLRIAGKGQEPVALARTAIASGCETSVWTPDQDCAKKISNLGSVDLTLLTVPKELPSNFDDEHTAFVLMFHDRDWEIEILSQALIGDAFFIGAVGSRATHNVRIQSLQERGIPNDLIEKIEAPIGLIPSMRSASTLAISTLAHIVDVFQKETSPQ